MSRGAKRVQGASPASTAGATEGRCTPSASAPSGAEAGARSTADPARDGPPSTSTAPSARPKSYGRRRAIILASTFLIIVAHVLHWKWNGRTLAPLELNEAMYTFELGIVTAGFLMFAVLTLATLIFGRFFCAWGCHILALEDLCAWLLEKARIRPKPVRARLLLWVPAATAFYMFVWPQIVRLVSGAPPVELHFASDAEGWASFLTSDFLRNLPGPFVSILTFVLCGFVIVYLLGSRSFCTYVCPYGAVFGLAERVAPGRIVARGDCTSCGRCTAACQSGIKVHEELQRFGTVVNPACMRDLDCVAACPDGNPRFGWTVPPILRGKFGFARLRYAYDFALHEELLMAGVLLGTLFATRGLYDTFPFFLALALGVMLAYLGVLALRAWTRRDVRLNVLQVKRAGVITNGGQVFLASTAGLFALLAHSGWIRWHEVQGRAALAEARDRLAHGDPAAPDALLRAKELLGTCADAGLFVSPLMQHDLALLADLQGDTRRCDELLQSAHRRAPSDLVITQSYAQSLANAQRWDAASQLLSTMLASLSSCDFPRPNVRSFRLQAATLLGAVDATRGDTRSARAAFELALAIDPDSPAAHQGLGQVLANLGELEPAAEHLGRAVAAAPGDGPTRYNLASVEIALGRKQEALANLEHAVRSIPDDPDVRNNLGWLHFEAGRGGEAETHLRRAVELAPTHAAARYNLARVLAARGAAAEAEVHFAEARRLDPRYAQRR
ncbi:MAG: tetratricopeptide repeat protein [Planctomycetes bacterium]|nr:tetratricopeptide repeat protein [Planctomycetota bacterium]